MGPLQSFLAATERFNGRPGGKEPIEYKALTGVGKAGDGGRALRPPAAGRVNNCLHGLAASLPAKATLNPPFWLPPPLQVQVVVPALSTAARVRGASRPAGERLEPARYAQFGG